MELKYAVRWTAVAQGSSNRTFMELKFQFRMSFHFRIICSNRTFMELKWYL